MAGEGKQADEGEGDVEGVDDGEDGEGERVEATLGVDGGDDGWEGVVAHKSVDCDAEEDCEA